MIRDILEQSLRDALTAAGIEPPAVIGLERPARREHGDWSSNVALATAKAAGRNPRDVATQLQEWLEANPPAYVERVELAGPGFLNFYLLRTWLYDVLRDVVEAGVDNYARSVIGGGRRVNIEFVSANPTGPVHAGHARGAAYGDSLARILERCDFDVTREFYINDRGVQMRNFAASLLARKRDEPLPDEGYKGDYIIEWAAEMPDDADPLEWGYGRALTDQRDTLAAFNVEYDVWFSERSMIESGAIDKTLADLREHDAAYEADGAVWLRSTAFGDDKDRVLLKSDGDPAYLLPDVAYHRDKFARGFDLLIDVWGADHHGHVGPMKAAVQALGHDPDELDCELLQMVDLVKDGEEAILSKRAGTIVELRDIIDVLGTDAARLTYLLQSIDTRQTIDVDVVTRQSMENPVFYIQMAHARIAGIGRTAAEKGIDRAPLADVDLSLLTHEREIEVLRALSELPEVVELACRDRAPHKITTWVRELAAEFHGFYHDCYVIGEGVSPELTQARLWLVEAARVGLAIGLDLLGVSAPESM